MVFIQGTWDIPTIAATIGQALIDTDDFTDADPDVTMGTVVKHTPTDTYILFKPGVLSPGSSGGINGVPGLNVIFSTDWDTETHVPSGTVYRGHVPLYEVYYGYGDLGCITTPYSFPIVMHIDKYGFIGTIQNSNAIYDNGTRGGIGALVACEFFPSSWMEYDDAQKPICFFVKRVSDSWGRDGSIDGGGKGGLANPNCGYLYIRPFNVAYGVSAGGNMGAFMPREAYRSEGNNKTMFDFPWYQNDFNSLKYPIAQTRRLFKVSATGGHAIGDIINWINPDGTTVHKYIVAAANTTTLYAIPYENAFDYAVSAKR